MADSIVNSLLVAGKDNKKTLESMEKTLKDMYAFDKDTERKRDQERREDKQNQARRDADLKKEAKKAPAEAIAKPGQKPKKGGLLDGLLGGLLTGLASGLPGILGTVLTKMPWGTILGAGSKFATALATAFGGAGIVAALGAAMLAGLQQLGIKWTGGNKVDAEGNQNPGIANNIDAKGSKSGAQALANMNRDRADTLAPAVKQTSRGARYDQSALDENVGNETETGNILGLDTRREKGARIAFYAKLVREMMADRDEELKAAVKIIGTRGNDRNKRNVYGPDEKARAEIEKDYEERLAQLEKRYREEGLSKKEVRAAAVQKKQKGGPITVPGSGSGDKVPMMLPSGSFVLNRNASNFLRRQTGGEVPTMLEPGELVYLNENIPRFQGGGDVAKQVGAEYGIPQFNKGNVGKNLRYLSTGEAMQLAKMQTGGIVLFQGHGDVPPGHSQPGTDAPNTKLTGKYKPTAEQYFMNKIAEMAANMSDSVTYSRPTGKYASGFQSGANWAKMRDLRNKGQGAIEIHADGYDGNPGGFRGKPGVLPGTSTGPTAAVGDAEKNIRQMFGMYGGTRTANILELDNIMKVSQSPSKYAKMLVEAAEGTGSSVNLTSGDGGEPDEDGKVSGKGTGASAVISAAKENVGLSKGVGEQCANTTRTVLRAAGHPDADKVTMTGDLDPEGTKYNGKGYAASFAGSDMGKVNKDYASTKPGDVILWKDTYKKYSNQPAGAITHVGIKGEGNQVYHHGRSTGWRPTGNPYPNKFVAGITLNGTGQADGANGTPSENSAVEPGGVTKKVKNIASLIAGALSSELTALRLAGLDTEQFVSAVASQLNLDPNMVMEARGLLEQNGVLPQTSNQSNQSNNSSGSSKAPPSPASADAGWKKVYEAAKSAGDPWPELTASQWALESGWGKHQSGKNNFFGIKARGNEPHSVHRTREVVNGKDIWINDKFRDFETPEQGILAKIDKWTYKVKTAKTARQAVEQLQLGPGKPIPNSKDTSHGVYATDPNYVNTIVDIMKRQGVDVDAERLKTGGKVSRKSGNMVPTMLEPGEKVFMPGQWDSNISTLNSAIPRFQTGGVVGMQGKGLSGGAMSTLETNAMEHTEPTIIPVPMPVASPAQAQSNSNAVIPNLPDGPSVAFLSDVINRTNMGGVFS